MDTANNKDSSNEQDPRRTGGATLPADPQPADPPTWRDYALRWAPYIGSILAGVAAILTALLK
ncbi:hypothetical protein Ade02nite_03510 [Paractinoplanes deccanensis]|uniref:Uncharacterized protein n=1 Tax=Paractinoplanes deccanensis TaxID=113561 RepID=A0ABQ3XVD3_9ACTN|nr:hypothetical protein [Actinoplanes deccanensis]GID71710.1 hypothetical protein Ade02nite_03510 [Actinoplanes deccanensis]